MTKPNVDQSKIIEADCQPLFMLRILRITIRTCCRRCLEHCLCYFEMSASEGTAACFYINAPDLLLNHHLVDAQTRQFESRLSQPVLLLHVQLDRIILAI